MSVLAGGARQAVNNCVKVKQDETVVIITDRESAAIGEALRSAAGKACGSQVRYFVMEDFGERPDHGSPALVFPQEIAQALKDADVSFYAAGSKKGELESFRIPMLEAVESNPNLRHAHMPNIDMEVMGMGMAVDYSLVQRLSAKVYELVKDARSIRVTTGAGTELTAHFTPKHRWVISDGHIRPGHWSNLPDGEVFTCVESVEDGSVLVVDGVLGDYFDRKYGLLDETPLTIRLRGSRAAELDCSNKKLLDELARYLKQDENADRLGEFAIGTAVGLDRLIGNLLQDEKFPGVHVAFGHGYPKQTGSNLTSVGHVDCVLRSCSVTVDGNQIMRESTFLFEY
jgi:aminopeptidase